MERYLPLVISLLVLVAAAAEGPVYRDPGLSKVMQIAIVCRDVEAMSKRWAAVLGVDPPKIETTRPGHETKMIHRGRPSEAQAKIATIGSGQIELEFLQPVGGPSSWQEYLHTSGEGVQHIAFKVADVDKTVQFFNGLGMKVLHQGRFDNDALPGAEHGSYTYIDSKDKLGVIIELLHWDADNK